jgi:uncharacterized membrane-anchored protein YjiN (DUF445 family)
MKAGRNRIGIFSFAAACAGFLFVTFQPWFGLERVFLFSGLSLRALLSAFFDASLVGALADWFAVSALFRSPLGLRLPHTDILAKNKNSIADAVPRFLTSFVNEERIERELSQVDFASKVLALFEDGESRTGINEFVRSRFAALLAGFAQSDGEPSEGFTAVVREIVAHAGARMDPASAGGALLRWGRREGLDERIIAGGADALRKAIAGNENALVDALTPLLKKNAGWQSIFVGRGTVERLLRGAQEELERVAADPRHDLRALFTIRLHSLSARLLGEAPDPESIRERIRSSFRRLIEDPATSARISRILHSVMGRLRASLQHEGAGFENDARRVEEVLVSQLRVNPGFRDGLNRGAASLVSSLIARSGLIEGVTGYLSGLLRNTDEREFVGRIEDAVWNDLQYIRLNGAMVGGLVGIVLAVISAVLHT